jgi:endonuclease/exonuclease/phosphatase family metal-dependent hydrolase
MRASSSRRGQALALLAALRLASGCISAADEAADPEGESFSGLKADGFCVEAGSDEGDGVLSLVNDGRVSFELLDDPVADGSAGLYRGAAEGIVAGRPFGSLEDLDRVPHVGVATCRALRELACGARRLCGPALVVETWNVEQFPLSEDTPEEVAARLAGTRPDVVGLQEVRDAASFAELVGRLGDYEGHPRPRRRLHTGGPPQPDRPSARRQRHGSLQRPARRLPARSAPRRDLDRRRGRRCLARSGRRAPQGAGGRRQPPAATRRLRGPRGPPRPAGCHRALVVGDWNDRLLDEEDGNVFGAFLEAPERFTFLTMPLAEAGAFSYLPFRSLIDHILATEGALGRLRPRRTEAVPLEQQIPGYLARVSDHRPVAARFSISPSAE